MGVYLLDERGLGSEVDLFDFEMDGGEQRSGGGLEQLPAMVIEELEIGTRLSG